MICKCGGTFEINPAESEAGKKSEMPKKARGGEVSTNVLSVIDAKKNHALLIVVECPFCGSFRARKIAYHTLLDLPKPGRPDAFSNNGSGPSGAGRSGPGDIKGMGGVQMPF